MDSPILQRSMTVEGSNALIQIELMQPAEVCESEWSCAYAIRSGKSKKKGRAYGADSVQAVLIALEQVRSCLLEKYPNAQWMGLPIDLAFPKSFPATMGMEIYRKIEEYAETEVASFVRRAEQGSS